MKRWLALSRYLLVLLALLVVTVESSGAGTNFPSRSSGDREHTYSARTNDFYNSFYDGFGQTYLAPEWFWVREDRNKWSLLTRPGYLRIVTQYGTLDGGIAKNILLRPAPVVCYELSTRVQIDSVQNYQEAALMLFRDDDNYIKLSKLYHSNLGGNVYLLLRERDGIRENASIMPALEPTSEMKMVACGSLIVGWYKNGTGKWVRIGDVQLDEPSIHYPYVGITAHNGMEDANVPSVSADFDFVQAKALTMLYLPLVRR